MNQCICTYCAGGAGPCRLTATQEDLLCDLCRKFAILQSVAFTEAQP